MKFLLLTFLILLSSYVYALAPFQHTGTVTAPYNDTSTIEIDGQSFLINSETIIHHYENGVLTEKVIPEGSSVGYEMTPEADGALNTISNIWLIRNDEQDVEE